VEQYSENHNIEIDQEVLPSEEYSYQIQLTKDFYRFGLIRLFVPDDIMFPLHARNNFIVFFTREMSSALCVSNGTGFLYGLDDYLSDDTCAADGLGGRIVSCFLDTDIVKLRFVNEFSSNRRFLLNGSCEVHRS
jgi:hypothetical protein